MGWLQNAMSMAQNHVWFERSLVNDRAAVGRRYVLAIYEHNSAHGGIVLFLLSKATNFYFYVSRHTILRFGSQQYNHVHYSTVCTTNNSA